MSTWKCTPRPFYTFINWDLRFRKSLAITQIFLLPISIASNYSKVVYDASVFLRIKICRERCIKVCIITNRKRKYSRRKYVSLWTHKQKRIVRNWYYKREWHNSWYPELLCIYRHLCTVYFTLLLIWNIVPWLLTNHDSESGHLPFISMVLFLGLLYAEKYVVAIPLLTHITSNFTE